MDEIGKLKKRWFGFRPSDVKRHVRFMKRLQETELDELRDDVRKLEAAVEALRVQLRSYPSAEEIGARSRANEPAAIEAPEADAATAAAEAPEADAAAAARYGNVIEFRRRATDVLASPQQSLESELREAEATTEASFPVAANMGFWGEANEVMDRIWSEMPPTVAFQEISATAAPAEPILPLKEERAAKPAPTPPAEAPATTAPQAQAAAPVPAKLETPPQAGSEAVSQEIRDLRNKYIVGKRAGEDLYDGAGRKIAAKGAVITEEIVEMADRAGKLAELIVNMVIPGLGD